MLGVVYRESPVFGKKAHRISYSGKSVCFGRYILIGGRWFDSQNTGLA
jgi:hypothetical protein